jgi:hypothetical protein
MVAGVRRAASLAAQQDLSVPLSAPVTHSLAVPAVASAADLVVRFGRAGPEIRAALDQ